MHVLMRVNKKGGGKSEITNRSGSLETSQHRNTACLLSEMSFCAVSSTRREEMGGSGVVFLLRVSWAKSVELAASTSA